MKGHIQLPDGSVFHVAVAKDSVPDVDDPLTVPVSLPDMCVDALSGRELDAAVASHVFGFEVEWRTNKRTRAQEPVHRLANDAWVVCPFYSERMAPSITLALRLQDLGWKQESAPRDPHVTLVHADGRRVEATGQSESEALAQGGNQGQWATCVISISDVLKIGEWIRGKVVGSKRSRELQQGLAIELHELRFTLAVALLQLRTKLRNLDQAALDLVRPIYLSYTARNATEAEIVGAFKRLLALGDTELIRYHNMYPGDPTRALRPVSYYAPLLTAQASNPSGVSAAIRQRLVDISNELNLFNQQVAFVQQAHDRTFDSSLSPTNRAANDQNLKDGTEKLAVRAAMLITTINSLVLLDGKGFTE